MTQQPWAGNSPGGEHGRPRRRTRPVRLHDPYRRRTTSARHPPKENWRRKSIQPRALALIPPQFSDEPLGLFRRSDLLKPVELLADIEKGFVALPRRLCGEQGIEKPRLRAGETDVIAF